MLRNRPDLVQQFIITGKGSFYRDIHILMKRRHTQLLFPALWKERKTNCASRCPICHRINLPAIITMLQVDCFLTGFPAENFNLFRMICTVHPTHLDLCCQLCLKRIEHAAVRLLHQNRLISFFIIIPHGRNLVRFHKIPAVSHRNRRLVIILHQPLLIRTDDISLYINRRKLLDTGRMHEN